MDPRLSHPHLTRAEPVAIAIPWIIQFIHHHEALPVNFPTLKLTLKDRVVKTEPSGRLVLGQYAVRGRSAVHPLSALPSALGTRDFCEAQPSRFPLADHHRGLQLLNLLQKTEYSQPNT